MRLPPLLARDGRPPELLVFASVPGRVGDTFGEESLDALLHVVGEIDPCGWRLRLGLHARTIL